MSTTTEPTTTTVPALSDAATIWCDEERWQVLRRGDQLGLELPPSNPTPQELSKRYTPLLPVSPRSEWEQEAPEKVAGWLQILDEWEADSQKYETGEWDLRGVTDDDWGDWMEHHPEVYARSCAAAYELADAGGKVDSTPPTTEWVGEAADATTTTTEPSTSATTASSSPSPGRLVPGSVVACPDYIEATFSNTGGTPVSIVEMILFIGGGDEPFGYSTDWTPSIDPAASATWRLTAANLGVDWIEPGLVSVGARPSTSAFEFVYAEGPNPHSSCTAVAPSTTTTTPPESVLDATGSAATCSTAGIDVTFKIRNTGSGSVELYQVALFPGGPMGHSFLDPDWWPLPTIGPGETVSHHEVFSGGSLDTFTPGDELEIHINSSDGLSSTFIDCS